MKCYRWGGLFIVTLFFMLWVAKAEASPSLDVGTATARPCEEVTLTISLTNEPGTSISATSNDIAYDPAYFTPLKAAIGPSGEQSGKDVIDHIVEPGLYRVGVLSLSDLSPIPDGIVAYITFEISCDTPIGIYILNNTPSCSTPQGDPVDIDGTDGEISVVSGGITSTSSIVPDSTSTTTSPSDSTTSTIESTTTTTTSGDTSTSTTSIKKICLAEELYGEYAPETKRLRYIRDQVLIRTSEGQEVIESYNKWSPVIVKMMEADEEFKDEVKEMVDEVLELIEEVE